MSRKAMTSRAMRTAILLLSCLIVVPIARADDYFHLSRAAKGIPDAGCPFSPERFPCGMNATDEPEEPHACSCLNCFNADICSIPGILPASTAARKMSRRSFRPVQNLFVSDIFHPPRA